MKKTLSFLFALVYASSLFASDTQVNGIWYDFDPSTKTASVTYKGSSYDPYSRDYYGSVVIPEKVTYNGITYSVTSIGDYPFLNCSGLTSITIPNSITTIGRYAFGGCSSLTSVTIPNSVTSIGDYAFSSCEGMISIAIGNSVTWIGNSVFYGCSGLTSVIWNVKKCNSISYYSNAPFYNISNQISSFIFGNEVEVIPPYLCYGMSKLTSITIPNSVTTIGDYTFYGCSGLTSVTWSAKNCNAYNFGNQVEFFTFGDNVEIIPDGLCREMSNLTSITIPNSVTKIGSWAFSKCSSLTSVTIGESVISIGEDAFYMCTKITSVTWNAKNCNIWDFGYQVESFTFGDNVEVIPNKLCKGMSKLTSITIPNSVTTIGNYAFYGCSGLTSVTIPNSVAKIGDYTFYGCSGLTSVIIGNSVTSIGNYTFAYCSDMTSITIPKSVTSIGEMAFLVCGSLKSVYITNLAAWCKIDFSDSSANPLWYAHNLYLNNKLITDLVIPNSITTIKNCAFSGCSCLTSVTIPNSVTTIGEVAFSDCSGLKSVLFDSNIPPTFGSDAFYNVPTSAIISVPCGYALNFKKVSALSQFKNYSSFGDFPYILTVSSSDDAIGTTEISNAPDCITNEATIKATTIYGYRLDHWSDGDGQNPRTISITKDTHLVAYFSKRVYWVTTYATNGQVQGNKQVEYLDTCALTATPNYGYHFTQWSDGITDNPRIIQVLSDTTFTAEFAKNSYSFEVKANDNKRGSVEGTNGTYEYQTRLTISATARMDLGYHFARWSDGNMDNPRTLTLTENTVLVAEFEENKCGNNLIWHLKDNELSITGDGAMYDQGFVSWNSWASQITAISLSEGITYIGNNAFASCGNVQKIIIPSTVIGIGTNAFKNCSSIKSVIIPKAVTTIGNYSFAGCSYLAEVTLGSSLNSIGSHAFEGDSRIESITTYAEITPNVGTDAFKGVSKQHVYLYVPENSIRKYQVDPNWNEFDIRTKSADKKPIDGDNPIVTPSDQDVTITWPITDGTDTYTLTITKNGEVVCVLTFNANGQLTNIAFAAPSHNGAHQAPAATLTAQGYQFTVTGLNPGTAYNYSVTATDAGGKTIAEHKGNFSTTGGTGFESVHGSQCTMHKYFHNGNLIIERNGIKYTATGQKVR